MSEAVKKREKEKDREKDKKQKRKSKGKEDSDEDSPPASALDTSSSTSSSSRPLQSPSASSSATSMSSSTPSSSGARLVHACLVELYEMVRGKAKGFGAKGLALVKTIDNAYTLLIYQPGATRHEFTIDVKHDTELLMLPDRWATFTDQQQRNWSVRYSTVDDAHGFARAFACCKDDLSAFEHTRGGPRRVILQDLAVGVGELAVDGGDACKIRYTVFLTSSTHPIGLGDKVVTKDSKRFTVGSGAMSIGIEQGLIGMKKKGVRFIVVPPMMTDFDAFVFGPHVPPNSTLLVEVTLTSLHTDRVVESVELSAPDLDSVRAAEDDGVKSKDKDEDSPVTTAASSPSSSASSVSASEPAAGAVSAASSLKDRMKNLSLAAAPALSILTAPLQQAHGHGHSHSHGAPPHESPPHGASVHGSHVPAAQYDAQLEALLHELQMSEYLSHFVKEGIRFVDLRLLQDADEWKVLVPQMGPRRRLMARMEELREEEAAAPNGRAAKDNGLDKLPRSNSDVPRVVKDGRDRDEREKREEREREERDREREKERETRERDLREREAREARDREVLREREHREREKEKERERERERDKERERERERDREKPQQHRHDPHPSQHSSSHHHPSSVESSGAAGAHGRSVSTLRSRFDYPPSPSGPHAVASSELLDAQVSTAVSEYHRGVSDGKEEMMRMARERIDSIKESAQQRFNALQAELDEERRGREDDVRRAKELLSGLRAELKEAAEEKAQLVERMRGYVDRLKVKGEEEGREAGVVLLRGAMDAVYRQCVDSVGVKELYEGQQLLDIVKKILKQATQHALSQQQQQQQHA